MNDVVGGLGAAIEGALVGNAVEPNHGKSGATLHEAQPCANCGADGASHYCGECGQKRHIHRTLSAIGHDIMHGVLHLDGKLWNTLPLLAFKPGALTHRYIEGERAKFVSPMSMFLFTIFAMFAVFQMVGIGAPADFGEGMIEGFTDDSDAKVEIQQQITTLTKERDGLAKTDPRQAEIAEELKVLEMVRDNTSFKIGDDVSADISLTGIDWLDDGIIKKWQKNPSLMLYKLQSNGYKFSWLLIPLSIPFVWLLFAWRRQFKAYDHAVFVTYSLSFMSLLFIAMSILSAIPGGGDWASLLLVIAAPVHLYKHLRYAYGLTRFSAFWRFCVLFIGIQIVMVLFLQALLLLGAF